MNPFVFGPPPDTQCLEYVIKDPDIIQYADPCVFSGIEEEMRRMGYAPIFTFRCKRIPFTLWGSLEGMRGLRITPGFHRICQGLVEFDDYAVPRPTRPYRDYVECPRSVNLADLERRRIEPPMCITFTMAPLIVNGCVLAHVGFAESEGRFLVNKGAAKEAGAEA